MSLLLLDEAQTSQIMLKTHFFPIKSNFHQTQSSSNQQKWQSPREETPKMRAAANGLIRQHLNRSQYAFQLRTMLGAYSLALTLTIYSHNHISPRLRMVTPQGTFLKIRNTRSLSQYCLKIAQMVCNLQQWMVAVAINPTTGEICIQLPIYKPLGQESQIRPQFGAELVYKMHVQHYLAVLEVIIKECEVQGATAFQNFSKIRTLENIFRYRQMIHINSHINESRIETEQESLAKERKKREDIISTVQRSIKLEEWYRQVQRLLEWRLPLNNIVPKCEHDFQLEHEEKKYIRSMLAMPIQSKPKNPFQNLMILNHIYVNDLPNLRLQKINSGGFSSIFITDLHYLYVYSSDDHDLMHPEQLGPQSNAKLLHKFVVIKKEEGRKTNRIKHQVDILKRIKNGCSIFLSKYYIITNKQNPHADAVVMDFIPSKNLKEFLHINNRSISLLTKLYLIFSIIQALRYIRDYHIVHLDLKPNNIMIYCNMLIKLIDFGESFHPDLASYKPGHTVPYSPPEVFNRKTACTSKSDVFALGVLLFEMLYNSYPFDFFDSTETVETAMQTYLERWYFSPEEAETYGQGIVMRILNNIISKCLALAPEERPELDWIGLIIKHCFELLH